MNKILAIALVFLSSTAFADVKTYAPGTPEYAQDGAIILDIFRARQDRARDLKTRRELARLLFPKGFTKKDIGTLDRDAGADGYVRYVDGSRFNRAQVHEDIAKTVVKMTDLEALKLRQELRK